MEGGRRTFIKNKVSIVTPVFNGEGHLFRLLDSILRQTYDTLEMILVDDGSEDNTSAVAESYRKKFEARGYEYQIITAKHKNASAAINCGLPYVTGEYLIWPDSDDVLEPESIEKRVEFLKTCPEYMAVRSLGYYFDGRTGARMAADEKTGDTSKENLFWDILEFQTFVCCGCYMLKSAAFFEIYPGRRIPEYDVGQNFQMLLPFMYYHKCPTICEDLYGVCVREGSHSRTRLSQEEEEKKYRDYEALVDDISDICRLKGKERNHVLRWKLIRRYQICLKYGRKKQARRALLQLLGCGYFRLGKIFKMSLWIFCQESRLGKRLLRLYQRLRGR